MHPMVPQRLFLSSSDDTSHTPKWEPQSLPKSPGFLPILMMLLLARMLEDLSHSCDCSLVDASPLLLPLLL